MASGFASALLAVEETIELSGLTLLALLQGLTEFLPVSSSGHLVLAQSAMGLEEPALALDVALHVGTLLAVVLVYRQDLVGLLRDVARGELREVVGLALATVPAGVVGVLFKDALSEAFHAPRVAAGGLVATALILVVGDLARRRHAPRLERSEEPDGPVPLPAALAIGCAQALAVVPGISRSGTTIAMGMLLGLAPARAARFSFLLSIPAILGAAVLSLPDAIEDGLGGPVGNVVWATVFAGLVGFVALRLLLRFVGRGAFAWFALYCALLATGALLLA